MKKIINIVLIGILICLTIFACNYKLNNTNIEKKYELTGIIEDYNIDGYLIKTESNQKILIYYNTINLNIGDKVKIIYDGIMTSSIPAQVTNVYKIEKINE